MLPEHILPQISPAAAKVYLVLACSNRFHSPASPPALATVTIPHPVLAQLAALARSSCTLAIRELCHHQLLARLPRHYHSVRPYLLLAPPLPPQPPSHAQPAAPVPTHAQPAAHLTPSNAQPAAHLTAKTPENPDESSNAHPIAHLLNTLRRPSNAQPAAHLSAHNLPPATLIHPDPATAKPGVCDAAGRFTPAPLPSTALKSLIATLSTTEKSAMLAQLQPLLATLSKLTALGTVPASEATS